MGLRAVTFRIVIWILMGAMNADAGNNIPLGQSSLSLVISAPEPVELTRTVLQCDASISGGQVVAISKDNQPISWGGDLLPNFQDSQTTGSSRYTFAQINMPGRPGKVVSMLTIDPVCQHDRGNYSCTVYERRPDNTNAVVDSTSSEIASVLAYEASGMCTISGPIIALRGDELSLGCVWRSFSSTLQWTDDSGALVDSVMSDDVVQIIRSSEFSVTVTDDSQGKMYRCTAGSNGCNTETKSCTVGPISVLAEPRVIITSRPDPIVLGGMAEFKCTVLPNATSQTYTISWHTNPALSSNRAYFSYEGPKRMWVATVNSTDQGTIVYCTVNFANGKRVTGQLELDISTVTPGQSTTVGYHSSGEGVSPSETTPSASYPPFLILNSFPATVAIISGGSILVALLLAVIVFLCCRGCMKRKQHVVKPPLRISPSTFGGNTPGHEVPGTGTDGMYMYATIFDPDEKWGATPAGTTPSRVPTMEEVDSRGYQRPSSCASTPPVYSCVGPPTFSQAKYQETNIDSVTSTTKFEISVPDHLITNSLYQSSGEYVDPEIADQQHVDREIASIRAENKMPYTRPRAPDRTATGYLAIGEVPEEIRTKTPSTSKSSEPVTYMEIND